jgi:putative aldouronate transport system substrate-binding protein
MFYHGHERYSVVYKYIIRGGLFMKKVLKFLALITAMVLLISVFAGCSGKDDSKTTVSKGTTETDKKDTSTASSEGTNEPSSSQWEYSEDTSPFEFTTWWASVWSWAKGAVELGWDDSPVYKYIEEKTGTKMHIDMPAGTETELVGPLIASGTYPDVVVFSDYNSPYLRQMIDAGLIYSWTELIDKYCPKMWSVIPDSQISLHADDDGILWQYVGFEYDEKWVEESIKMGNKTAGTHGTNVIFVRNDILKAFGKDDITSLDDFTEYLRFAKDNYPDVDPLQLFVANPRSSIFTHLRATFGCHLSNTYPQSDGTIKYYMYDPAYVDYLSWLNGLYRYGVITDNQLTYDASTMDTKLYSGNYGAIMSATYTAYNTIEQTLKENYGEDTDKLYVAVGPIQKEGIAWKAPFLRSKGSLTTVITKNAKNPERIIKFFEFLLTDEGQMTINGGVEGVHWWRNSDGTIRHEKEKAELGLKDLEAYCTKYKVNGNWAPWCKTAYWEGLLNPILTGEGEDPRIAEVRENRLYPFIVDIWKQGYAEITDCIKTGTDLDVIRTKIEEICTIASMKMIAAKNDSEFKSIYDACIKEIEALGVAQVEEAYTAEHKEQCKRLGINPGMRY